MSMQRREFLSASMGLTIGLVTSSSVSSAVARDANSRIQLAMIGVGGRGSYLMNLIAGHQDTVITTVCDVNQNNSGRAAESVLQIKGSKPKAVDDFRRVLDDSSIDAIVIATPHHWHTPIAIRALNAGKHIYVEKPAAHVFREGRSLVEAARRNQRIVQHGTQMRSSEVTRKAAEVLASGVLGEIKQAKAWGVEPRPHWPEPVPDGQPPDYLDYDRWVGPAPQRPFNSNRFRRWNNYRDYGNGEIGGDGIHDIDLARWGLGAETHPVRIVAQGSRAHLRGESDFPDNMLVTYEYANGKVLIYENRNFAPYKMHGWDNGNIFFGTDGYMIFSRRGYFQTYLGAKEELGPGMKGNAGIDEHIRNFLDAVRDGKGSPADAEVAHLSCALVHLGEIAYRTGRSLQFDPQQEQFVADDEATAMLSKQYRQPWNVG